MTLAFAAAPLTVTQPVTFLQLIWAVSLGYFAFGESVDIWVVIGGFVILSSVTFLTWREAVLKRGVITPISYETKV
jgi:drug/metabolite transporter (DMT)-like permease